MDMRKKEKEQKVYNKTTLNEDFQILQNEKTSVEECKRIMKKINEFSMQIFKTKDPTERSMREKAAMDLLAINKNPKNHKNLQTAISELKNEREESKKQNISESDNKTEQRRMKP